MHAEMHWHHGSLFMRKWPLWNHSLYRKLNENVELNTHEKLTLHIHKNTKRYNLLEKEIKKNTATPPSPKTDIECQDGKWMKRTKAHGHRTDGACVYYFLRASIQYVLEIDYETAFILVSKQTNANHIHWLLLFSSCFFPPSTSSSSSSFNTTNGFTMAKLLLFPDTRKSDEWVIETREHEQNQQSQSECSFDKINHHIGVKTLMAIKKTTCFINIYLVVRDFTYCICSFTWLFNAKCKWL